MRAEPDVHTFHLCAPAGTASPPVRAAVQTDHASLYSATDLLALDPQSTARPQRRHGEPFNVLRYELNQHYDSHYDSFSEEEYGPQTSQRVRRRCKCRVLPLLLLPPAAATPLPQTRVLLCRRRRRCRRCRQSTSAALLQVAPLPFISFLSAHPQIATVLLYLADVEDGGETVFLLEGKDGLARLATIDYKACDTGIKVAPQQLRQGPAQRRRAQQRRVQQRRAQQRRARPRRRQHWSQSFPRPATPAQRSSSEDQYISALYTVRAGQASAGRRASVLVHSCEWDGGQALAARRLPGSGGDQVRWGRVVTAGLERAGQRQAGRQAGGAQRAGQGTEAQAVPGAQLGWPQSCACQRQAAARINNINTRVLTHSQFVVTLQLTSSHRFNSTHHDAGGP